MNNVPGIYKPPANMAPCPWCELYFLKLDREESMPKAQGVHNKPKREARN